jgi:hypothetical protein
MQITIDTKRDTSEDIKKVIKLLSHLVGEHPTTNQPNLFNDSIPPNKPAETNSGNVFGNMFENPQSKESQTEETAEIQEEKEEEIPELIPY